MRLSTAVVPVLVLLGFVSPSRAQANNPCDQPGESPDLTVGAIASKVRYGSVGGVTAFALGTTSCNLGTCWLNVFASTPEHPVIGQNMFRLEDGRFEQIGQSWLMHTYAALQGSVCSTSCLPAPDVTHLGVSCSDAHTAASAGEQVNMGPKSDVNPYTGVFPFPPTNQHQTGDAIYKRLQVHDADLDPTLHAGALYFVESQHVSHDDASGGGGGNNASYRPVTVSAVGGVFDFALTGATERGKAGIEAWKASDPAVAESVIASTGDGRFIVAAKATALAGGVYHYEYAVQNLDSHRSARSFRVPVPPGTTVTNAGFHDVDYHSGEPYDGTDWTIAVGPGDISWTTSSFEENANANALRWGTLYNFRFDADAAPGTHDVAIELFRPGVPVEIATSTVAPGPCSGPDQDQDGFAAACDCDDLNPTVRRTPGEALSLVLGMTGLSWSPPLDEGGDVVRYDVLRSGSADDFMGGALCVATDESSTTVLDGSVPASGGVFFYLVRAENDCPAGEGTLGNASSGAPRSGRSCP